MQGKNKTFKVLFNTREPLSLRLRSCIKWIILKDKIVLLGGLVMPPPSSSIQRVFSNFAEIGDHH